MNRSVVNSRVKAECAAVRQVLLAWDPIGVGGTAEDEYDGLVHLIVSAIHQGKTAQDIAAIISSELTDHFGVSALAEDISRVAANLSGLGP
jgi:hypothetical protein